ncbi:MAG: non-canonical purine NTP pyrophosphatase, RdgB/HAM1 family [Anaerolineales bacterium]|nr:RdgB/HAM1 family non-canonical purine NTP pyrophosphatase [Anaerolineae bacterium]PWB51968.1 MAG: non-canonical purine NTP pyrophosphatase, RdgB/HAM1 family [Anaerolineales bacterium]
MQRLLIATGNRGKLVEIRSLLDGMVIDLVIPEMLGISLHVDETGATYEENAALKAEAFAKASGLVTLADDSGLEVDLLGGLPGIRSARFSPLPGASDADRRAYLLGLLDGQPRPWKAHFHCTVAIATPALKLYYAQGNCPGEIIPEERGTNGFGYDPIFLLTERHLTMAELSMDEKNQHSHRARAIKAAIPILGALLP